MQAQQAEAAAAPLQTLKQLVVELVKAQHLQRLQLEECTTQSKTLQKQQDALQVEQKTLAIQVQEITAERDFLQQERDRLRAEHDMLISNHEELNKLLSKKMNNEDKLKAALEHVFPYAKYRSIRPDLNDLEDKDLLSHFAEHGIHEEGKNAIASTTASEETLALEEKTQFLSAANVLLTKEIDDTRAQLRRLLLGKQVDIETNNAPAASPPPREATTCHLSDLLRYHLTVTRNASDKWESYFEHYSRNLHGFRNQAKEIRLLEIGVQNGGSLETWKAFLGGSAVVIGTDINNACSLVEFPDDIQCFTGDATDATWTSQLCQAKGPFDIIIDDGSHVNLDIEKTFALLFPSISPGGIYICEDLHTAYWERFGGSAPRQKGNVMEMFKEIADLINLEHWQSKAGTPLSTQIPRLCAGRQHNSSFNPEVLMTIESIEFCNSMVFIRKNKTGICTLGRRMVSSGQASVDTAVLDADGERAQAMWH